MQVSSGYCELVQLVSSYQPFVFGEAPNRVLLQTGSTLFVKVKRIQYILKLRPDYPKFIVSNQKEDSVSIQRVNARMYYFSGMLRIMRQYLQYMGS